MKFNHSFLAFYERDKIIMSFWLFNHFCSKLPRVMYSYVILENVPYIGSYDDEKEENYDFSWVGFSILLKKIL